MNRRRAARSLLAVGVCCCCAAHLPGGRSPRPASYAVNLFHLLDRGLRSGAAAILERGQEAASASSRHRLPQALVLPPRHRLATTALLLVLRCRARLTGTDQVDAGSAALTVWTDPWSWPILLPMLAGAAMVLAGDRCAARSWPRLASTSACGAGALLSHGGCAAVRIYRLGDGPGAFGIVLCWTGSRR